jgi:UDP-glucuronate 4-epimerase
MSVIVTGGLGFIGSHLSAKLASLGEEVHIIDSISDYYSTDLKRLRRKTLLASIPKSHVHELNVCDKDALDSIILKVNPRKVIHLAAQAGVRLPISQLHKYTESNLTGFSNVLQSVINAGIPDFLYASSSSVYGNSTDLPYKESAKGLLPISFYGATKLSNEILAHSAVIGTNTRARGMRFFTVYGPWGRPDMAYFRLAASLFSDYQFHRFGDGLIKRDFTYVDDTIEGITRLSKQLEQMPSGNSDVVNLGGGNPYSLNDLIDEFEKISGKLIQITNEQSAFGDVKVTVADSALLENLTDFIPKVSLATGAKLFYDWASSKDVKSNLSKWVG